MRGLTIETDVGANLGSLENASLHSFEEHESFMSEIQLRGIVDKMAREARHRARMGMKSCPRMGP
jgi:hypothetical protein